MHRHTLKNLMEAANCNDWLVSELEEGNGEVPVSFLEVLEPCKDHGGSSWQFRCTSNKLKLVTVSIRIQLTQNGEEPENSKREQ